MVPQSQSGEWHMQPMHEYEPPCDCKPKIVIEKVPYPVIEKIKFLSIIIMS